MTELSCTQVAEELSKSVFVSRDAEIHEMPVNVINRPLASSVDESKVLEFIEKMKVCGRSAINACLLVHDVARGHNSVMLYA